MQEIGHSGVRLTDIVMVLDQANNSVIVWFHILPFSSYLF